MNEVASHKVVEVLNSTPDSETVAIRNVFTPIFARLWELAAPVVTSYQTDVIHDALMLGNSNVGDKFLWGFRPTGTTLLRLRYSEHLTMAEKFIQVTAIENLPESYHLIEITKLRVNHADGYVTWINAKDLEHVKRVIVDNIPT